MTSKVEKIREQVVVEIDTCITINPELKGKITSDFPELFKRCDIGDGKYFLVPIEDEGINHLEVMELLQE